MSAAVKRDLTEGSIPRHLVRMTLPMVWGIMALLSFQLVDAYYISRLGTLQLASISYTFPAQQIVDLHDWRFPPSYPALKALKGVGEYTAAAIGSIAFGLPEPVVDGNVYRVLARVRNNDPDR